MIKNISNTVVAIFLFLTTSSIFAQDSKLKLHSFSVGIGLIGHAASSKYLHGINFNADVSTNLNKNLFSFYYNTGVAILSNNNSTLLFPEYSENYNEINATYGREIELINWIKLEGHLGLGYFNHKLKDRSTDFLTRSESTIGFPIRLKLLFYPTKHFAIGLNPNLNLNSLVNTFSGNLILQYRF